jgi:hypothetical protein
MAGTGINAIVQGVIAVFAATPGVSGITFYDYEPLFTAPDELPVGYVYPKNVREMRHGLNATRGRKYRDYDLVIELWDTTREPETARAAFYDAVDAISAALRANQTLTAPATNVMRSGEDQTIEFNPPSADEQTVIYKAFITTPVREEFAA